MDNWLDRALRVTPWGSQTRSKAPRAFPDAYPKFLTRGLGCYVWDTENRAYIDWICSLGAVTLGHAHPVVVEAVERQIRRGTSFSLPTTLEIEVSEQFLDLVHCGRDGMIRWVKTGSEANEAAVRVARMATGRDVVLVCGYHGWLAWYVASRPEHPGVPRAMASLVGTFAYNDLASLDAALASHEGDVAAIMLEPALIEAPQAGFLEGVRERATRHGAVLIFDEIVMGGRWALGGGQEFFGVTPDLATFGKALGGGLPVSALLGRREIMEHAYVVSGTFGGEALALAAVQAVLGVYQRERVITTLWNVGRHFQDGFNDLARSMGAPFRCLGYPCHPKIVATYDNDELMPLLLQETSAQRVLFHRAGFNTSLAHETYPVVERTLEACEGAFRAIQAGVRLIGVHTDPGFWRS